jgi:hypothetical protein
MMQTGLRVKFGSNCPPESLSTECSRKSAARKQRLDEIHDLQIAAGDGVGFSHGLNQVSATRIDRRQLADRPRTVINGKGPLDLKHKRNLSPIPKSGIPKINPEILSHFPGPKSDHLNHHAYHPFHHKLTIKTPRQNTDFPKSRSKALRPCGLLI